MAPRENITENQRTVPKHPSAGKQCSLVPYNAHTTQQQDFSQLKCKTLPKKQENPGPHLILSQEHHAGSSGSTLRQSTIENKATWPLRTRDACGLWKQCLLNLVTWGVEDAKILEYKMTSKKPFWVSYKSMFPPFSHPNSFSRIHPVIYTCFPPQHSTLLPAISTQKLEVYANPRSPTKIAHVHTHTHS